MVKVFSFCVYGNLKKYCNGLIENLKIIERDYVDFEVWVYHGNDVHIRFLLNIKSQFPKVKLIPILHERTANLTIYRFFPIDDEKVNIMFVRDADSRIHKRDQWCINEFIIS